MFFLLDATRIHHCREKHAMRAVDDGPVGLWITHLRCCGLRACRPCGLRTFGAVDYDAAHLWISGLGRRFLS